MKTTLHSMVILVDFLSREFPGSFFEWRTWSKEPGRKFVTPKKCSILWILTLPILPYPEIMIFNAFVGSQTEREIGLADIASVTVNLSIVMYFLCVFIYIEVWCKLVRSIIYRLQWYKVHLLCNNNLIVNDNFVAELAVFGIKCLRKISLQLASRNLNMIACGNRVAKESH